MRVLHVVLTLLLAGLLPLAHAASFDCRLAHTHAETLVCADADLSRLDDQLHAAYAQLHEAGVDGVAEQVLQRAWLKARNACQDADCMRRAYGNRIAELQARAASRSPIVGIWKKEYGCDGIPGVDGERCKEGEHDVFRLAITVDGDKVCIIHMATAQLGNRVDEVEDLDPSMTGKLDARIATVRFQSSWGGTGAAMLRVEGNTLHWRVTGKDDGESWIPDDAVLARVPAGPFDRLPVCR